MEKIYIVVIDEDGYIKELKVLDTDCSNILNSKTDIPIEVSEEIFKQVTTQSRYSRWKYENGQFIKELLLDESTLKIRREQECFKIVDNRSPMWYNNLSTEQYQELQNWYQAWLDVTETKIIPEKPEWLK